MCYFSKYISSSGWIHRSRWSNGRARNCWRSVFLFLTESVVVSENFYQEEFYIRRIHNLITDFLALMPMKVKCNNVGWVRVVEDNIRLINWEQTKRSNIWHWVVYNEKVVSKWKCFCGRKLLASMLSQGISVKICLILMLFMHDLKHA